MALRSGWTEAVCGALLALVVGGGALSAAPSLDPERAFLASAAGIGRAMVETGKLAAQRGGAPEMRSVGTTVGEDWTAWLRDLEQLAAERVVTLPTTLDLEHQATLERLQAVSGEAFDAAYLAALASDLEAAERPTPDLDGGRDPAERGGEDDDDADSGGESGLERHCGGPPLWAD